ncbi:MAG: globin [Planctomycetales bacterium]
MAGTGLPCRQVGLQKSNEGKGLLDTDTTLQEPSPCEINMTENTNQLFSDSLERCSKDALFLDRFYELFISNSAEVKELFRDTDFAEQTKMLAKSLSYMVAANQAPEILREVAEIHNSSNHDIDPRLYSDWLDCLIDTVQLTDPGFDGEVESAWRTVMQSGMDYMVGQYDA